MSVGQMGCFLWSVCDWNIYQKMIRILVYRGLINEFSHDVPQNTVFCRKRKKEKSFFTTSPTHCSEMFLNLKPKSHFWLYKRYKCLNFLDAWICLIIDFMYFIHCLGQCYWVGLRTVLWQGEQQENMSFVGVSKTSREKKYANTKADWKSFQTFFMKKSRWEG